MSDRMLDDLFAIARAKRADTSRAEYGFETRLMARLRSEGAAPQDTSSVWAMVSWRLMPIFLTCTLAVAICEWRIGDNLDEAAAYASVEQPESAEVWTNLN
jgi:hypothetical protein